MYSIFLTGTAGSGKTRLASVLKPWYEDKGASTAIVNLDPGAVSLPYAPDVDVRDFIDLQEIMESYQLGSNGALILASDMIASKLVDIQEEIDTINPEYAIFDTVGQMELFAYRQSGPYFFENLICDGKTTVFLFDSTLVSSPTNFISITLLAASIQLRLKAPQIPVLSKIDLSSETWKTILGWSSNIEKLRSDLSKEQTGTSYLLSSNMLQNIASSGFSYQLIPLSAASGSGMVELSGAISRVLKRGEEVEY
ncbi:MAG TPA: ATP/GTP-binding protein [Nitrososphaerales archaeon]